MYSKRSVLEGILCVYFHFIAYVSNLQLRHIKCFVYWMNACILESFLNRSLPDTNSIHLHINCLKNRNYCYSYMRFKDFHMGVRMP